MKASVIIFQSVSKAETAELSAILTRASIHNQIESDLHVSRIRVAPNLVKRSLKVLSKAHMIRALNAEHPLKSYLFSFAALNGAPFWILRHALRHIDRDFEGKLQYSASSEINFLAIVGGLIALILLAAAWCGK